MLGKEKVWGKGQYLGSCTLNTVEWQLNCNSSEVLCSYHTIEAHSYSICSTFILASDSVASLSFFGDTCFNKLSPYFSRSPLTFLMSPWAKFILLVFKLFLHVSTLFWISRIFLSFWIGRPDSIVNEIEWIIRSEHKFHGSWKRYATYVSWKRIKLNPTKSIDNHNCNRLIESFCKTPSNCLWIFWIQQKHHTEDCWCTFWNWQQKRCCWYHRQEYRTKEEEQCLTIS